MTSTIIYNTSYNGKSVEVIDERKEALEKFKSINKTEKEAFKKEEFYKRKRKQLKRKKFIHKLKFCFSVITIIVIFAIILHVFFI